MRELIDIYKERKDSLLYQIVKRIFRVKNHCMLCDQWDHNNMPHCEALVDKGYYNILTCTENVIRTQKKYIEQEEKEIV